MLLCGEVWWLAHKGFSVVPFEREMAAIKSGQACKKWFLPRAVCCLLHTGEKPGHGVKWTHCPLDTRAQPSLWAMSWECYVVHSRARRIWHSYIIGVANILQWDTQYMRHTEYLWHRNYSWHILYLWKSNTISCPVLGALCGTYRVFFITGPPPKKLNYGKPRLGFMYLGRPWYTSPNLT